MKTKKGNKHPKNPIKTSFPAEACQSLFDSAPELLLVLDTNFRIVAASGSYLHSTMTKREDIIGRGIFEVFPDNPDDPRATGVRNLTASLNRVVEQKVTDTMPIQKYDIRRPEVEGGGFEERYCTGITSPVFDVNHEISFIIHQVTDVTEFVHSHQKGLKAESHAKELLERTKQMEAEIAKHLQEIVMVNLKLKQANAELQIHKAKEALRESEDRFRLLVDQSFDGIFIHENFRIVDMNQQLADITGYSRSELLGITPVDLFTPDSQQRLHDYISSGKKEYFEGELIRKDGRIIQIESFGAPCRFHGRKARIVALRNITERKKAEEALRESELRFRAFMDNSPTVAWAKDETGRYVYLSGTYEKHLGLRGKDCLGKTDIELWPPDIAEEFRKNDLAVLAGNQNIQAIEESTNPDGERCYWYISKFPFQDATGKRYVGGIGMDITGRLQAEEAIKASLQEKEVLLREIYHRTKNNMQVIISLLRLQADRVGDSQLLGAFEDTENRIRSMALVHGKLYQSKDLSHIDLEDYIKDLANFLLTNYQVEPGKIALHLDLQSVIVNIETAIPCGLILNELIANAIKYAFPGLRQGTISIFLSSTTDGDIEIKVADDGVGLPPELDIWNTDSLGLKIVAKIGIKQLNGELELRRNQGTEFRLSFRRLDYKERI